MRRLTSAILALTMSLFGFQSFGKEATSLENGITLYNSMMTVGDVVQTLRPMLKSDAFLRGLDLKAALPKATIRGGTIFLDGISDGLQPMNLADGTYLLRGKVLHMSDDPEKLMGEIGETLNPKVHARMEFLLPQAHALGDIAFGIVAIWAVGAVGVGVDCAYRAGLRERLVTGIAATKMKDGLACLTVAAGWPILASIGTVAAAIGSARAESVTCDSPNQFSIQTATGKIPVKEQGGVFQSTPPSPTPIGLVSAKTVLFACKSTKLISMANQALKIQRGVPEGSKSNSDAAP